MPGVLMLQTLVETGAWFLRIRDDFRHSIIVLREARNVKFGSFLEPGRRLLLSAELLEAVDGGEHLVRPRQPAAKELSVR